MGGSGGGGAYYGGASRGDLKGDAKINLEELEQKFRPQLQEFLDKKLLAFNDRNVDLIRVKLDQIEKALEEELDSSVDLRFGGSVSKHTYVDGISDVDALVVLRGAEDTQLSPSEIHEIAVRRLSNEIPDADVRSGEVAVTVDYGSGLEIQLIPALKVGESYRVPAWRSDNWSKINPKTFTDALVTRNLECNNKLVPTIKLAKAINANLPESQQLSGYHVESIAISAFRDYEGPCTTAIMLPKLFEEMSVRVLTSIRDSTGQSVNVDGYLGKSKNDDRTKRSHVFDRIGKRMRTASAAQSPSQWEELFGED